MSVSFTPTLESMQYQIACECGNVVAKQVFPTFEVAYKAISGHPIPFEKPVCDDLYCEGIRVRAVDEDRLTVNMANSNAYKVMKLLGLDTDELCGAMDATEFLSIVENTLAVLPVIAHHRNQPTTGFHYEYAQERLTDLTVVAKYAAERHAEVVWG